jgi:hypothetical protein
MASASTATRRRDLDETVETFWGMRLCMIWPSRDGYLFNTSQYKFP